MISGADDRIDCPSYGIADLQRFWKIEIVGMCINSTETARSFKFGVKDYNLKWKDETLKFKSEEDP